jgi:hypothetical protein
MTRPAASPPVRDALNATALLAGACIMFHAHIVRVR